MTREEFIKQRCKIDNITLEEFEEQLNSLVNSCQEEIRQLKKQVETKKVVARDWEVECKKNISKVEEKETQQKEFVKYLEDEIKEEKDNLEKLCELYKIPKENNGAYKFAYSYISKIEMILQKYKKIIGDNKQ